MRASAGLYDAEQRFQSGLNGATKSGGVLNLDFCAFDRRELKQSSIVLYE